MSTRKLISFDWALKKLLRSKANFGILEGFLSELLRDDIHILEVIDSEPNKDDACDKYNRVDLKVRNAKNEILIVEVQYERELDYLQRILYATSKTVVEQMREGAPYCTRGFVCPSARSRGYCAKPKNERPDSMPRQTSRT